MNMFKKTTFVRFCFASAYKLPEELGLSTEQLICLYKECIEMAKHCNDISTLVNSCMQFVVDSNSLGKHADSLRFPTKKMLLLVVEMQKAEVLRVKKLIETAKENEIAGHKAMMEAYLQLGRLYFALKHYQDATDSGQKCIEIAREIEDRSFEVCTYLFMGNVYNALSDYGNAIIYFEECIELAVTIGDKDAVAHAYSLLGKIYYSLEKYDDAISNCNKCLHIDKEDNEVKSAHVIAYLILGEVYQSLKKYDEAIQNFKQCMDVVNRVGIEKKAEAKACLCVGETYMTLEQYNDAVHYIKKCIDMTQETGDQMVEAEACLRLSSVYLISDDLKSIDNAIQYGKKGLDISQETGDKKAEMEGRLCLARAYIVDSFQLNEVSQSIDAGMTIATELGDKKAIEKFKEIRFCLDSKVGFPQMCDTPSVKEVLQAPTCSEDELLQDLDQAVKTGNKTKKYRAGIRLYNNYLSKKEYEKTINCLEQLKEMDLDPSVNIFCSAEMGSLYQLMGQNDMALHSFEQGLLTAESCSDTDGQLSHFYYGIGKLYTLNGELNSAEQYLREAIRCFEAIFTILGSLDEFKISIFDKYIDSYKQLAILLIGGEKIEEAFLVLDRCRARALKDLMMSNFKMEQKESNDEHLKYSDVLSLVSRNDFSIAFYSLCVDVFLKFFIGGETNLHYSSFPNHSLQIDVDRSFNEMGVREVVNCENRSLDKEEDIQKEQSRSKEEYERLYQPTAFQLNLDSNTGESNENSAETNGSTLEDLFDILECDKILSSKQEEVVIIPEGPLYQVPFPALRDRCMGKYLSETKRIRLAPSLAILKHFEDYRTDQTSDAKPLIIGNPLVGKVMMDGEEKDIQGLLGAQAEAILIAYKLGVKPLICEAATKQAVLEKLQKGVSVVHIAAHGILSKATIVLAPSPEVRATKIPDEEDYMLTMADVQQAQVRAQLVVLSCCHSGRGEIRAEGVVGMCRAFLASGARAVVASLWAIDDDATLYFMTSFYGNLKNGKSASTSLQLTMNEMRNTYKEPKYWAPFFIMGDDITLKSI